MDLITPIIIELDKTRHFKITMEGMCLAESKLQEIRNDPTASMWTVPINEFSSGALTIQTTMLLLYAGLVDEDPDLTFEQVKRLPMDPQDMIQKVRAGFLKFYRMKDPNQEEEIPDDEGKKKSLNGTNSGRSPESSLD